MNLLRETIRKVIQEMAMKQSDDLPGGYFFACSQGIDAAYGMPQILLLNEDGYTAKYEGYEVECFFAENRLSDKDIVEELGYRSFDLRRLDSYPSGWGPLVTEIAIEWTTLMGGVLFPDRREMSNSAQRMWDKFSSRSGFEEFIHPTRGVKGYRRTGPMTTIRKLEAKNQLFRRRLTGGEKTYTRLSQDFER